MKNLLVATDFSACAGQASAYAMGLAQQAGAEVHFFTQVHIHPLWDVLPEKSKRDFPESFAILHRTKVAFHALQKEFQGLGVPLTTTYAHGDLLEMLEEYVVQEEIDLMVMGATGTESYVGKTLGSNTRKVVRDAPCPVLLIKESPSQVRCRSVLLVSDFQPQAQEALRQAARLLTPFGAKLHLLPLEAPPAFGPGTSPSPEGVQAFVAQCAAHGLVTEVHHQPGFSLEADLPALVQQVEADWVAVAPYGQRQLMRVFTSSLVETLVSQLSLPVLALSEESPADPERPFHTKSDHRSPLPAS